MIERDIVAQKMKEFQIQEYIGTNLKRSGYSHIKLQRTPLGEKIVVYASRPGLVVGRQGQNIRKLTGDLKEKFGLENPQIEVGEVENIYMDPNIVTEMIALSLERFGTERFKGIMHKTLTNVIDAGALGIEIIISGKIPSARARSWRVYAGYLKKCGDIAVQGVRVCHGIAQLKSGIVGIKVKIMPSDLVLPDKVELRSERRMIIEEISPDKAEGTMPGSEKQPDSKKGKDRPKKLSAKSNKEKNPAKKPKPTQKQDNPPQEKQKKPKPAKKEIPEEEKQ